MFYKTFPPQLQYHTILPILSVALKNGCTMDKCFQYVKEARSRGLKVPVIFMGYCNPFIAYGLERTIHTAKEVGKALIIDCYHMM